MRVHDNNLEHVVAIFCRIVLFALAYRCLVSYDDSGNDTRYVRTIRQFDEVETGA